MKRYRYAFHLLLFFAIGSCSTEEPFHERPYPKVDTLEPTYSTNTVKFHGKITYKPEEIIDHGFRWARNLDPINGVYSGVSFGAYSSDDIEHTIPAPSRCGSCYEYFAVRAFVQSATYTYYGPIQYY